jgi:hypothetical protein
MPSPIRHTVWLSSRKPYQIPSRRTTAHPQHSVQPRTPHPTEIIHKPICQSRQLDLHSTQRQELSHDTAIAPAHLISINAGTPGHERTLSLITHPRQLLPVHHEEAAFITDARRTLESHRAPRETNCPRPPPHARCEASPAGVIVVPDLRWSPARKSIHRRGFSLGNLRVRP